LIDFTVTQRDIAQAVHLVIQFLVAPHSTHYGVVLHILRYVKGTMFHGLHFLAHFTLTPMLILMLTGQGILLATALLLGFVYF
jgi:hypothetical protein